MTTQQIPDAELAGQPAAYWTRLRGAHRVRPGPAGCEGPHPAPAIHATIHEGTDDADYVTTLKVLQQLIRNEGGTAG
ncbi:hypothetical protein [Streptomyces alboniger]|uniref:Uncharacterized protein n=1 Tax=Streptomyces alboniger TaxID=132473 RepID=A0A5J6HCZ2_STRAD|nr:hypothetical protein CP975_00700 [Streptomyces alboniger]